MIDLQYLRSVSKARKFPAYAFVYDELKVSKEVPVWLTFDEPGQETPLL